MPAMAPEEIPPVVDDSPEIAHKTLNNHHNYYIHAYTYTSTVNIYMQKMYIHVHVHVLTTVEPSINGMGTHCRDQPNRK